MIRTATRRINIALCIVIVCECIALALVPFAVPDIAARLMRLTVTNRLPTPAFSARATQPPYARPLTLRDTFDTPSALWDQSNVTVQDGHLAIDLRLPHADAYSLWLGDPTIGSRVMDFRLSATMTQISGPDDASYGIRFRQDAPDSYLMVALNPRGYWSVVRSNFGARTELVPWTYSHTIEQGIGSSNELTVDARGPRISIAINGVVVDTIVDQAAVSGQLTLAAATADNGSMRVDFDAVSGSAEGVAISEDFTDNTTTQFSMGGSYANDGAYHLRANAGVSVWQNPLPQSQTQVTDFDLSVDTRIISGDRDSIGYGIVYGDTGDFGHSILLFGGNGTVQLLQSNPAKATERLLEPMKLPMLDTSKDAVNRITIRKIGSTLTLFVNDQEVGSIDNLPSQSGSVGMILVCGTAPGEVAFDNFVLTERTQ